MTFAAKVISFNQNLAIETFIPTGVEVMNPYQDKTVFALTQRFYSKFYNDSLPRTVIFGINPGRFGGGTTGIPFTDPIKLEKNCGIENNLPKKAELSANFIYRVIDAYGGPEKFYKKFYISAVSPLGFTQGGKNLNYYDVKELRERLLPFIVDSIKEQLKFGVIGEESYCLGEGENFKFLSRLNNEHAFFKKIVPLPHPRFIMQYKRKKVDFYVAEYLKVLDRQD